MIINEGRPGKKLPTLTNPGVAGDLLSGKQLIGQDGNIITGTIPSKDSNNISVSGRTVTVPAGYYPSQASKSIASATQATPSITVSSGGLITASATQSAGYVTSGTKSATKQLTTQAGKTVTPSTSQQTAVASGRYTTGAVYVAGDADLKAENIKSGVSIFGVAGALQEGDKVRVYTGVMNSHFEMDVVSGDLIVTCKDEDVNHIKYLFIELSSLYDEDEYEYKNCPMFLSDEALNEFDGYDVHGLLYLPRDTERINMDWLKKISNSNGVYRTRIDSTMAFGRVRSIGMDAALLIYK